LVLLICEAVRLCDYPDYYWVFESDRHRLDKVGCITVMAPQRKEYYRTADILQDDRDISRIVASSMTPHNSFADLLI
jgi:hypothetical protein